MRRQHRGQVPGAVAAVGLGADPAGAPAAAGHEPGQGLGDRGGLAQAGRQDQGGWDAPTLSRLYRRLAASSRLVLLDKRGTGMSDRAGGYPPLPELW
jgi:hypothetical protein